MQGHGASPNTFQSIQVIEIPPSQRTELEIDN